MLTTQQLDEYTVKEGAITSVTLDVEMIKNDSDFDTLYDYLEENEHIDKVEAPRSTINDEQFLKLARLPHIISLRLKYSRITDAGIMQFIELPDAVLGELDIESTTLQEETADRLIKKGGIGILGLANTGLTDAALVALATHKQDDETGVFMVDVSLNQGITKNGFYRFLRGPNKFQRIQARGLAAMTEEAIVIASQTNQIVEIFCDTQAIKTLQPDSLDRLVSLNKTPAPVIAPDGTKTPASLTTLSVFAVKSSGLEMTSLPADHHTVGTQITSPILHIS